ncbi:unnamed protein product [[Actinomadura] parvosata subsp. kistnae]|nr:unnamed protein product [Actinomadura parvosata subsp. kistnae]
MSRERDVGEEMRVMRRVQAILRPRPAKKPSPLDLRTPAGRNLPY